MDTHRSRCFFRGSSVYSTGNDPNPTDAGPSGGEVLTHFCHFISSVKPIRSDACSVFTADSERWHFPPVVKGKWPRRDLHACSNVSVWKSDETVNSVIGTVLVVCFLLGFIFNFATFIFLIVFGRRKEMIWGMLSWKG